MDGKTTLGSSSPANPNLLIAEPQSITIAARFVADISLVLVANVNWQLLAFTLLYL